ncbi:hypothetical protein [Pseudomonas sp. P9_31]|uniref:hypothetical protein n=1 Tax=Pseudomonas sp. P9_31 TaxID=3043448 RepID=UPI002A369736|nr:hypothetical protein [Pseudomonas sp. P9_31]WPN58594.1 hypothetical protein QMK51_02865 [Pseudomonas sp. P9_31]
MNEYGLYAVAYAVFLLLFFSLKSYRIRKWLGIALVALGFASILCCRLSSLASIRVSHSTNAVGIGATLFFSRARYAA